MVGNNITRYSIIITMISNYITKSSAINTISSDIGTKINEKQGIIAQNAESLKSRIFLKIMEILLKSRFFEENWLFLGKIRPKMPVFG